MTDCIGYKKRVLEDHAGNLMCVCHNCGALPHGENSGFNAYGLDVDYMVKNLKILIRDIKNHKPAEIKRALKRLSDAI